MTSPSDHLTTLVSGESLQGIVLSIPCDHCRARVGEHCQMKGEVDLLEEEGFPFRVHVHRITPVWLIFRHGYLAGRRDMKEQLNKPTT